MTPHSHETNNAGLKAPQGHNEALVTKFPDRKPQNIPGWCAELPVTVIQQGNEPRQMVSFWAPSREDIENIRQGAMIALTVYGDHHPMVWVGTEADFNVLPTPKPDPAVPFDELKDKDVDDA